jgi:peptidoglycan-associated lipoprotein
LAFNPGEFFMTRLLVSLSLVAAATALVGCASKTPLASAPAAAPVAAAAPAQTATAPAAQTGATGTGDVAAVDLTRQANASFADLSRMVYFDFDSFAIRPDFKPVVDGHARRLASERNGRLVIAGHADERGSREYNLALGQKRADAVARSIVLLGGDAARIETVSFGEERPKAQGRSEEAWAQNRRAELQKQ